MSLSHAVGDQDEGDFEDVWDPIDIDGNPISSRLDERDRGARFPQSVIHHVAQSADTQRILTLTESRHLENRFFVSYDEEPRISYYFSGPPT